MKENRDAREDPIAAGRKIGNTVAPKIENVRNVRQQMTKWNWNEWNRNADLTINCKKKKLWYCSRAE